MTHARVDLVKSIRNVVEDKDLSISSFCRLCRLCRPSHGRQVAMRWPTNTKRPEDQLVDILCWCLMPNHYHNLVQEKINGGVSSFSKKLSGGYTQYFNLKNERNGVLFQGRSKIILIKRDEHFMHLPFYILSNPVKLVEPNWKEEGIKDIKKVIEFVENYKWSSYPSIIGKENRYSFIINKKLFFELFNTNEKKFRQEFINWLNIFAKSK